MKIVVNWVTDKSVLAGSCVPPFNVISTELEIDDGFDLDGSLARDELEIVALAAASAGLSFSRDDAMLVDVIG